MVIYKQFFYRLINILFCTNDVKPRPILDTGNSQQLRWVAGKMRSLGKPDDMGGGSGSPRGTLL